MAPARSGADERFMSGLYLEDIVVGQVYRSRRLTVDADRVKAFAAEFDPQPFHLDDDAARQSVFGGLVASGWHTAALTMRLLVEGEFTPAGGLVGAGADELRWPRPVRPGDTLQVEGEVLEVRPSRSKPHQGVVKTRITTTNQHGEAVQVFVASLIVPRRPAT
jgi:acyl dehydratase